MVASAVARAIPRPAASYSRPKGSQPCVARSPRRRTCETMRAQRSRWSPDPRIQPHPGVSPPGRPAHRIEPGWRRERTRQGMPFDLARVGVPYQQISLMVDVAANGVRRPGLPKLRPFGRETREIIPRHLAKSLLLPGVEGGHEMAREMRRQHTAVNSVALFIVEHRCKRPQPGIVFAHCLEADQDAEHKPRGWSVPDSLWP